jgi:four helix bundle protein
MQTRAYDLEERLIKFGVLIIQTAQSLPKTAPGNHLAGQLTRSGTSPAFQYGEAQAAESRADFVHKLKIGLKELRETFVNLRMIRCLEWIEAEVIAPAIQENNELISIFVKSIQTATIHQQEAKAARPGRR